MNGHVTPQIRSPRANTGGSQRATKYSSSTSAPEDEREASSEQSERNLKRKLIRSESAIAEVIFAIVILFARKQLLSIP